MNTPTESAAQESELLPCICGRNDKGAFAPIWCVGDAQKNLGWHIECFCGWQGPKKESLAGAIAAWNTRAPQPPITKDAPAPAQDGVEVITDKIIAEYKEHYDFPSQGESHMHDCITSELEGVPAGEADRRDAERYRWLVENATIETNRFKHDGPDVSSTKHPLDEAIDAVIAQQKETGNDSF